MSYIQGEGKLDADVMLIGEQPGYEEIKYGRPFVGRAGGELNRYLNGYTCPLRRDLFLTNLKREQAGKVYLVADWELRALWAEIAQVKPKVIVTLGHHVTRYFLGDVTLEAYHGIPHAGDTENLFTDYQTAPIIFPAYNPAAVLHSPGLQAAFAYDMRRLGLFLKGKLAPPPVDEHPGTYLLSGDGKVLFDAEEVDIDTEGWVWKPHCLSWSTEDYFGCAVRAKDVPAFAEKLKEMRPRVGFHNALADLAVLREMGCDLDAMGIEFDDTMVMAYLLGIEPQGLKPLAYRHAGAKHDDYSDIVAVPNARIAEEWIAELACRETTPEKVRNLMLKMLTKDSSTLRKRWADGRSREILVDELGLVSEYDADPPEATLDEVPEKVWVDYASRDADLTGRVRRSLRPQITAMGLDDVYNADIAIIPMIDRMQHVGLDTDVQHFRALSQLFRVEEQINAEDIERLCGRPINPRSGDQVAEYLFDELKLHEAHPNLRIKKTKSKARLTTNDKVLESMKSLHPSIPLFTEGREIRKMYGTYSDAIPRLVGRDGRLHPRYRITRAETGRLTAADPNVLALPKHSTRGKLIRMGFRAGPDHVLGEWDLDQIEMRVFAHDSQDPVMLAAFASGKDLHADTAALLFSLDYATLYALYRAGDHEAGEQRFAAKKVNFGILMGMTPYGLLDQFHLNGQLHWTLEMCDDLLKKWHRTYEVASRYIDRKHAEARQYGFVRDMWGRLRWLEGIHSTDKYIAEEAERQAQATPTQSGAQGIIKRAMALLWPLLKQFRNEGMWVECLLQVHDALVLEYCPRDAAVLDAAVLWAMSNAVELSLPVTAKGKLGVLRMGDL